MSFFQKIRGGVGIDEELETPVDEAEESTVLKHERPTKEAKKILVKKRVEKNETEVPAATEEKETDNWFEPEGELAVDVYQTGNEIVIQSTIAGLKADNLDISIENDIVTILGERQNSLEHEEKDYFIQECYWGAFSRQIILPEEVDAQNAEASIKDGVLIIRLPKFERVKVKKIRIKG
ncbi:MAG: Hsp20/alpha crystallin family protein [Candidatus Yanofskybacteria bacterium]|nr:Hsp20/alpha crystallin family protein [Candidatus Yanofskybacteria bacterium]